MRTLMRATLGAAVGLTLGVAAAPLGSQAALAASCYGSAPYYVSPGATHFVPNNGYFRTTSRCSDINIKPRVSRWVRVYFPSTGHQPRDTWAPAGQWTVVATNVRDNVQFAFYFDFLDSHTGQFAA